MKQIELSCEDLKYELIKELKKRAHRPRQYKFPAQAINKKRV